jgi:hypothetical protein
MVHFSTGGAPIKRDTVFDFEFKAQNLKEMVFFASFCCEIFLDNLELILLCSSFFLKMKMQFVSLQYADNSLSTRKFA